MSPVVALLIKLPVRLVVFTGVFWFAAKKNKSIVFEKKWAPPLVGLVFAVLSTGLYWLLKTVLNLATIGMFSFALPVLINGVQVHPVNRRPLHLDLFLVNLTEELTVDVPLVATGTSTAVSELNGTLLHPTDTVRVKALPDHLPQAIEYSIQSLVDFDGAIHVRDLTIPDDVTLLTDGDEIIAKVQAPRIEVEEVPVAAEGEEGEAAEGEAGEAPSAEGESAESGAAEDSAEG